MSTMIECPRCGNRVPINEAIEHEVEKHLWERFEAQTEQKAKDFMRQVELETKARYQVEIEKLQVKIQSQLGQLEILHRHEADLAQREASLVVKERSIADQVSLQVNQARQRLSEEISVKVVQEQQLRITEKDTIIEGLRKDIGQLERRVNQGSQQVQGEAGETNLLAILQKTCPSDKFDGVARTGDILQTVINSEGLTCGQVLWESKNTQNWQNVWINKAMEDKQARKADFVIVASSTLPQTVTAIGIINGVWVTGRNTIAGSTLFLHEALCRMAQARHIQGIEADKLEDLRTYLHSPELSTSIQRISAAHGQVEASTQRLIHAVNLEAQRISAQNRLALDLLMTLTVPFETILGIKIIGDLRSALPAPKLNNLPVAH